MEKKRKPEIRFRGFNEDWEQRKLREVAERVQKNDGRMNLPTLTISAGKGWLNQEERFSGNIAGNEQKNYTLLKKGELSYNHGNSKLAKYGAVFELKTYEEALVPKVYHSFRMINENSPVFTEYLFATKLPDKELGKLVSSGARMDGLLNISFDDFFGISLSMPNIQEQKAIGEYFSTLDHLITLHQRKLEKLQNFKKSMLEKMFPQNDSKTPQIRFKGFTNDWEQRKLGEYCEMFNGDRSSKYPGAQDMVSVGIPFINAGDLEDGHVNLTTANKITREKYDDLGGAKLQLGDIVYCLRGTLGKNAYIDNFTEGTVASSLVAIRPKNIDGRYLFHILNSDIEYRQRVVHDEGAAQPNLSAKSVSEFIIPIPDIDEQEKISSYLDNLSTLITLHQRKLEKLQNMKKSMLEKMFV